jgi:AcrR family transcriptional regulator
LTLTDIRPSSEAMSQVLEVDTRGQILETAERLFRQIGYTKTTVADIAKALRMSPANVYRFFDSKRAIIETVARNLMAEVEEAAAAIARKPLPAAERLRELMTTVHHMNAERFVGDEKIHEMVYVAMTEKWNACQIHVESIIAEIGRVIGDGAASGEFKVDDVAVAAGCTCMAMARFFNPVLIAQCADMPGPSLPQMIDFVLAGLGHRAPSAPTG